MKKLLLFICAAICLCSCNKDYGQIYGIVSELGSSEPISGLGVELYKNSSLLLRTTTFDDGHFEFNDLIPGSVRAVRNLY